MSRLRSSAVLLAALFLPVAACGSDDSGSSAATTEGVASSAGPAPSDATSEPTSDSIPFSVEAANGTVTLPGKPMKIVSLAPTHTETLFAIGAGDQVVAVDDQSNYPPEAAAKKSELSGLTPNVEAIANYEPDLVVIADDFNQLAPQLEAVNIPVWSGPAAMTFDDAYTQIEQLGVLTGHVGDATELVGKMQSDIDSIVKTVTPTDRPLTYYHELDNTFFSVTSDTFIGQVYDLAGLHNIADGVETDSAYPQLNAEFIITSNPDIIFLADAKCCQESAATVMARDGWGDIAAVKNGNIVELDDDLASRWGPRIPDFLQTVVDAVNTAAATSTTMG